MKGNTSSLAFTSLAHFANDGSALFYPILITYYVQLPGMTIPYLGVMAILFNLVSGALSTPIGKHADRTGSYGLLISLGILLLGFSAIILSLPFVLHGYIIPFIVFGAVILGCGQAFYHPLGAAILTNTFSRDATPRVMGINGSFGSLGRAIMPTVLVVTLTIFGDFHGLIIYSIYSFISSAVIFAGLRGVIHRHSGMVPKTEPENNNANSASRTLMPYIYLLTGAVFVRSLFLVGTTTFMPAFLDGQFGSKAIMTTIISLAFILPIFGQPLFGLLTSKKGGKFTVVLTFISSTIFFGLFLVFSRQLYTTVLFFSLYSLVAYSGFPVFLGYVGQIVPGDISGKANGIVWGVGQTVGGAVGAAIITTFTLFFTVTVSIELMFVFAAISIIFLPFLPSRSKLEQKILHAS